MLAAGVPVLGSALGGIPDYVLPGRTGWLNRTAGGAELAEHMTRLITTPTEVAELRRRLRSEPSPAVKPMADHLDELDSVYAEVAGAARPSSVPAY
jgi:glycosyltransferase involved in cell wall biosynthesis